MFLVLDVNATAKEISTEHFPHYLPRARATDKMALTLQMPLTQRTNPPKRSILALSSCQNKIT